MTSKQFSPKKRGRKPFEVDEHLFDETAMLWLKGRITVEEACQIIGCRRSTWYKYTKARGYFLKK